MLLVFADDLTGAAEIAGVGLRYGLAATVAIGHVPHAQSGLSVISTETRSLLPEQAAAAVTTFAKEASATPHSLLFKKVDSVLRGPVLAELEALLAALPVHRILLVPCNPGFGRTIRDGRYWVDGKPIDETHFRADPEHPIASSDVRSMLGPPAVPVTVAKSGAPLPGKGIIVGEARGSEDMAAWAEAVDEATLRAGAAEFFAAVLEARGLRVSPAPRPDAVGGPTLVVSGSASEPSHEQISRFEAAGVPVLRMPRALFEGGEEAESELTRWSDLVVEKLQVKERAIMTIGVPVGADERKDQHLSISLARAAARVLEQTEVRSLWVDGGATAGTLMRTMNWQSFHAVSEVAPGAVLLRPFSRDYPLVLLKPGSYQWPVSL